MLNDAIHSFTDRKWQESERVLRSLEDYLQFLASKGFLLQEDAIGFIYFGKHYTNAKDELVITAVELTLKAQLTFDGSFYMSLLEMFITNGITTKSEALRFVKEKELLGV